MSQDEARQLGFALIAVLVVLVVVGGLASIYFYTPSESNGTQSVIDGKLQAEELSDHINDRNEASLKALNEVATTSY